MFTQALTRATKALRRVADEEAVRPFDVRVLVAIHDRGREATTEELAADLETHGSAVRRAALTLRAGTGLVHHLDGRTDEPPKPGTSSRLVLTDSGEAAALRAIAYSEET